MQINDDTPRMFGRMKETAHKGQFHLIFHSNITLFALFMKFFHSDLQKKKKNVCDESETSLNILLCPQWQRSSSSKGSISNHDSKLPPSQEHGKGIPKFTLALQPSQSKFIWGDTVEKDLCGVTGLWKATSLWNTLPHHILTHPVRLWAHMLSLKGSGVILKLFFGKKV